MTGLIALDVGGTSPREEIVWSDSVNLFFLDLDVEGGGHALAPAPAFPVGPLAAVNITGTGRKELVAASGEDLFQLDLECS
ncbi:MAG: hypothetical protein ACE5IR_24815 [bacterium]